MTSVCLGAELARHIMGWDLRLLIHYFEWERVSENAVGLTKGDGLTMPKLEPLDAMCKIHKIMKKVLYKFKTILDRLLCS